MMIDMDDEAFFSLECGTCLATGTTACADCVVAHLLANDDGPVEYVTVEIRRAQSPTDRAIELFRGAGLLDEPVQFVDLEEFAHAATGSVRGGAVPA
jgi:hypothetical protein